MEDFNARSESKIAVPISPKPASPTALSVQLAISDDEGDPLPDSGEKPDVTKHVNDIKPSLQNKQTEGARTHHEGSYT